MATLQEILVARYGSVPQAAALATGVSGSIGGPPTTPPSAPPQPIQTPANVAPTVQESGPPRVTGSLETANLPSPEEEAALQTQTGSVKAPPPAQSPEPTDYQRRAAAVLSLAPQVTTSGPQAERSALRTLGQAGQARVALKLEEGDLSGSLAAQEAAASEAATDVHRQFQARRIVEQERYKERISDAVDRMRQGTENLKAIAAQRPASLTSIPAYRALLALSMSGLSHTDPATMAAILNQRTQAAVKAHESRVEGASAYVKGLREELAGLGDAQSATDAASKAQANAVLDNLAQETKNIAMSFKDPLVRNQHLALAAGIEEEIAKNTLAASKTIADAAQSRASAASSYATARKTDVETRKLRQELGGDARENPLLAGLTPEQRARAVVVPDVRSPNGARVVLAASPERAKQMQAEIGGTVQLVNQMDRTLTAFQDAGITQKALAKGGVDLESLAVQGVDFATLQLLSQQAYGLGVLNENDMKVVGLMGSDPEQRKNFFQNVWPKITRWRANVASGVEAKYGKETGVAAADFGQPPRQLQPKPRDENVQELMVQGNRLEELPKPDEFRKGLTELDQRYREGEEGDRSTALNNVRNSLKVERSAVMADLAAARRDAARARGAEGDAARRRVNELTTVVMQYDSYIDAVDAADRRTPSQLTSPQERRATRSVLEGMGDLGGGGI